MSEHERGTVHNQPSTVLVAPGMATQHELIPSEIRDISPEVLGPDGRMRILPASYWATTTPEERALFGRTHGAYSFPTTELVECLREIIGDRKAIEIGAGNGVLAEALGITATDTREQETPEYKMLLALQGNHPPVRYGDNVMRVEAKRAVRGLKPQVVIACWVTQDYDPSRPWNHDSKNGGVDERFVIDNCETYVLVGNEEIHRGKYIWSLPHTIEYPHWLYSKAMNGTRNFIAVWERARLTA